MQTKQWLSVHEGTRSGTCSKCAAPVVIHRTRYYQRKRGELVSGMCETTPEHACSTVRA